MRPNLLTIALFILLFVTSAFTENYFISGTVLDADSKEPIIGANVGLLDSPLGGTANLNGEFYISVPVNKPFRAVVSHISYKPDTIEISPGQQAKIFLTPTVIMGQEVEVEAAGLGSGKSEHGHEIGGMEIATRREIGLTSLGDMLQGIGGANVQVCCALDNRAELRLLGLPGAYTEITVDGAPEVGGLASNYRLYSYPVIGVERMEVMKGASSAYNQAKAFGGRVDINTRKPSGNIAEGSIALYRKSVGGTEIQAELASELGGIGMSAAFDLSEARGFDRNDDGWTESPAHERTFGRLKLLAGEESKIHGDIAGLYIGEARTGGMIDVSRIDIGHEPYWVRSVQTERYEGTANLYVPIGQEELKLSVTGADVTLDQIVGSEQAIIEESGFVIQPEWSGNLLRGEIRAGTEYRREIIEDDSPSSEGRLDRTSDRISFIIEDKRYPFTNLSSRLGLRIDGDSEGKEREWAIHPRMNLIYEPSSNLLVTGSAGSGGRFRPSVQDLLEGYDEAIVVEVPSSLKGERGYSFNSGLEWKLFHRTTIFTIAGGGYFSIISDRILPIAGDDSVLTYINADGPTSIAGLDLQMEMDMANGVTVHLGGEIIKTKAENDGQSQPLLFTPEWRGFAQFMWDDFVGLDGFKLWSNLTAFGPQSLPENAYGLSHSDPFATTDVTATFRTGPISFTIGVRNVFDIVQSVSPLQGTADPFASGVSSELIYGPLVGRTFVASTVFHFGLPENVLKGAGYGGMLAPHEDEQYYTDEHGQDGHKNTEYEHIEDTIEHKDLIEANVWLTDDEDGKHFTCPVMGNSGIVNDNTTYTDIDGKRYYHCCPGCKGEDKVRKALGEGFVIPGNVISIENDSLNFLCPVMKNTGVVTDETTFSDYDGRRYYFCCASCEGKFEQNPEKYINN